MAIIIRRKDTDKLLELGGGANPQVRPRCMGGIDIAVDVRACYNEKGEQTVDFTADFEEPLPIQSEEFDGVLSVYCIEHITWRKVKQFVSELFRVLKPGGKVVIICPNTEAQMQYALNLEEWGDVGGGKLEPSCMLFGDGDYPENTHKTALSPRFATKLFSEAGFENIIIQPYGELGTDMCVEAVRPAAVITIVNKPDTTTEFAAIPDNTPREKIFDKIYFNGGSKWGGYAAEGYWDYPVHIYSAHRIMEKRPESALEIGCARGYIVKRLQDAGIRAQGLEISKHCWLTRACEGILTWDLCKFPWPIGDKEFDLCYSLAVLEHIPEEFVASVFLEMVRVSKRGLHGVDFGSKDDGFDKSHLTIRGVDWWRKMAPNTQEIVDKESLETGPVTLEMIGPDGKVKLNLGCFMTQFHHGWINVDIHDLSEFSKFHHYNFMRADLRQGLPSFGTGSVDMIFCCHMLEHVNYQEGLAFLRECRRIIKPDGVMRIIVPDASSLLHEYLDGDMAQFDQINDGCEKSTTDMGKLWSLLGVGHFAAYDWWTLKCALEEAGFEAHLQEFRKSISPQMLKETVDMLPCLSLYVDATPKVG